MGARGSHSPRDCSHRSLSSLPPSGFGNGFITRLPKRIVLIRHGESVGNFDEAAYSHTPDWTIPLTEEGIKQSKELGVTLKGIVGNGR